MLFAMCMTPFVPWSKRIVLHKAQSGRNERSTWRALPSFGGFCTPHTVPEHVLMPGHECSKAGWHRLPDCELLRREHNFLQTSILAFAHVAKIVSCPLEVACSANVLSTDTASCQAEACGKAISMRRCDGRKQHHHARVSFGIVVKHPIW